MATNNTSEILVELLTLGDELPATPQATELQNLLKQLLQAAKAERSTARLTITNLQAERDGLAAQVAAAGDGRQQHPQANYEEILGQLATTKGERDGAIKDLADVKQQLATTKRERDEAASGLAHAQEQLDQAQQELQAAHDKMEKLRAETTHLEGLVRKQTLAQRTAGAGTVALVPGRDSKLATVTASAVTL